MEDTETRTPEASLIHALKYAAENAGLCATSIGVALSAFRRTKDAKASKFVGFAEALARHEEDARKAEKGLRFLLDMVRTPKPK